jgi:hypothetical protein
MLLSCKLAVCTSIKMLSSVQFDIGIYTGHAACLRRGVLPHTHGRTCCEWGRAAGRAANGVLRMGTCCGTRPAMGFDAADYGYEDLSLHLE